MANAEISQHFATSVLLDAFPGQQKLPSSGTVPYTEKPSVFFGRKSILLRLTSEFASKRDVRDETAR